MNKRQTDQPKITHMLFDADGVLFAHTDKLFSERIIDEYGADRTKVESFFAVVFPECIVGKKDMKQELGTMLQDWNWPGSTEELMDYWFSYEHNTDQPLIEYVKHLSVQGITSSIATNNDHYRAEWLFNYLNLDDTVFTNLYAAGDMGTAKPEHGFFQKIIDDLAVTDLQTILFWDDTLGHVTAARAFGIQAELYTTFAEFEETMSRYV